MVTYVDVQPTLPLNRFFGVCLLYPYLLSRFGIIPNGIITTTFNNKLTIYFNAIDNVCDTEHTLSFCVTFKFIIRRDRLDHSFVTDGHYCTLLFITYSSNFQRTIKYSRPDDVIKSNFNKYDGRLSWWWCACVCDDALFSIFFWVYWFCGCWYITHTYATDVT